LIKFKALTVDNNLPMFAKVRQNKAKRAPSKFFSLCAYCVGGMSSVERFAFAPPYPSNMGLADAQGAKESGGSRLAQEPPSVCMRENVFGLHRINWLRDRVGGVRRQAPAAAA
jgi:hypothetical protein